MYLCVTYLTLCLVKYQISGHCLTSSKPVWGKHTLPTKQGLLQNIFFPNSAKLLICLGRVSPNVTVLDWPATTQFYDLMHFAKLIFVQLGPKESLSPRTKFPFGPKLNTKVAFNTTTHHHPPTHRKLLG